jgi:protein-S-isoprenylcysteine O-methyltransferase Ste14
VIISVTLHPAQKLAFYAVVICWWLFVLTFWLKKRPAKVQEAKRDWTSLLGLGLQSIAYGLVWFDPLRRKMLVPGSVKSPVFQWGLAFLAVAIALGSVFLVWAAARQLGKQWALAARLVEGHDLIQDGPYRFVRNPIYTGMFGMLLATGLVVARWGSLAIAIIVFLAGTYIRIRSEEQLLRQAFGPAFEEYKRKVPALIPGVY